MKRCWIINCILIRECDYIIEGEKETQGRKEGRARRTLWQIRYKQMWQARMENNSADTDGRCSSGQDTCVYASYAREYESKQRTTAVTGASVLCFSPRRRIRMSWKEFLRRLVTAEFLPPEAISNYSTYRYTRDTPTSSRRRRKEEKTREKTKEKVAK